jgi:hypothetical protein
MTIALIEAPFRSNRCLACQVIANFRAMELTLAQIRR